MEKNRKRTQKTMERKGWGRRRKKQENGNGAATELLLQNQMGSFGDKKGGNML